MKQLAFDLVPQALPTLENFVAGRNAELVQRVRELVAPDAKDRSLYIWGGPASGRSHLLQAAIDGLQRSGARALYFGHASGLGSSVPEALDAAAIDDVDRLDAGAQGALFNLYNRLRETHGAFIAAGSVPPAQLPLRPDVVTRLAWGLVYEAHALSDDEKAQALAEHAAARGFSLPSEVARYLLAHVQRDMRSLIAMLESLDRYSLESKRPVTLPLLRELLRSVPELRDSKAGDPGVPPGSQ